MSDAFTRTDRVLLVLLIFEMSAHLRFVHCRQGKVHSTFSRFCSDCHPLPRPEKLSAAIVLKGVAKLLRRVDPLQIAFSPASNTVNHAHAQIAH